MSAIITSRFRLENASNFKGTISTDSVYLAIGKSDNWSTTLGGAETTPPTPVDSLVERNDFWQNAIALKKVDTSLVTHIIPRYDWTKTPTTPFVPWDDSDGTIYTKPFYALADFKVYKLINKTSAAGNPDVKPTWVTQAPQDAGDGYVWKYMYTLTAAEVAAFMTNNYMPVKTATSSDTAAEDVARFLYQGQCADDAGKIYRIKVASGGSGYTVAPTVTIKGDGTGATAEAVLVGNSVGYINVTNVGSGYNVAYVTITGGNGNGATAQAVLSPKKGHGTDPVAELGGFYIGMRVVLNGPEGSGDFIVSGATFRQIGIIRNPYMQGSTTVATDPTLSALKTLTIASGSLTGTFSPGDTITAVGGSGAVAYVDSFDSSGSSRILKYHQNDKTGYVAFTASMVISNGSGGQATISTLGNPEVARFTGDVMFVENRTSIIRSSTQLEDIKIILEF